MRRSSRARALAALFAVLALLTGGCGSRLSTEERAEAIAAVSGGEATGGGTATGGTNVGAGAVDGGTAGGSDGSGGAAGGGGDTGSGGGGAVAGAASCAKATRGTDTGVTASEITVATLADISGVQPGLFQSAHQAARAATAYINSVGGICGRELRSLPLDSKTDSGGNRSAMLEACDKAFAVVGSMSAFDDGSAKPGQDCGIPDMTAITTNAAKYDSSNTFPIYPNSSQATA
ncbi:MAG: ABC transporter substrate-binding protein, partial [Actinomycetota bacterium]